MQRLCANFVPKLSFKTEEQPNQKLDFRNVKKCFHTFKHTQLKTSHFPNLIHIKSYNFVLYDRIRSQSSVLYSSIRLGSPPPPKHVLFMQGSTRVLTGSHFSFTHLLTSTAFIPGQETLVCSFQTVFSC